MIKIYYKNHSFWITILAAGVVIALSLFMFVFVNACSESVEVAREEFGPRAMLKKYEWFKDAAATLDKKRADIKVYRSRVSGLKEDYKGVPRKDWPRSDREQLNLWRNEVAGVTASYNSLASEYNSQMVKFNWRFANAGTLPGGATEPLPREFKPYLTE